MRHNIINTIIITLLTLLTLSIKAQADTQTGTQAAVLTDATSATSADTIAVPNLTASLMIAEPSLLTAQSTYGHAFIRLAYPDESLDFCFTVESLNKVSAWEIITGDYRARLMAIATPEYLAKFAQHQRSVAEYPLNLTNRQIQALWQNLDERMVRGTVVSTDFVLHGCAAELVQILMQNLPITYDREACKELGTTYFEIGNRFRMRSSFGVCAIGMCFGEEMHAERTPEQLAYIPTALPSLFSHATIDGHPLLADAPCRLYATDGTVSTVSTMSTVNTVSMVSTADTSVPFHDAHTPVLYYIIGMLAVVTVLCLLSWRIRQLRSILNITMMTAYTLCAILIPTVSMLCTVSAFGGWNWCYVPFNLLPVIVIAVNSLKRPSQRVLVIQRMLFATVLLLSAIFMALHTSEIGILSERFAIEQPAFTAIFAVWAVNLLKQRS